MQSLETLNAEEERFLKHLMGAMAARNEIIRIGAERAAETCLQHNTRPRADRAPVVGSSIDIVRAGQWVHGWRMGGVIGSNVIAEQDS